MSGVQTDATSRPTRAQQYAPFIAAAGNWQSVGRLYRVPAAPLRVWSWAPRRSVADMVANLPNNDEAAL